ncbi:hypothetical protein AOLI_G00298900 [Acnodon oligacanthus]
MFINNSPTGQTYCASRGVRRRDLATLPCLCSARTLQRRSTEHTLDSRRDKRAPAGVSCSSAALGASSCEFRWPN